MSKRKDDDHWNPTDYDDEPRSNGNFGLDPQQQEAADRARRGEKDGEIELKPSLKEVFDSLDKEPWPEDFPYRDMSPPQERPELDKMFEALEDEDAVRRLLALGGTAPDIKDVPRRKVNEKSDDDQEQDGTVPNEGERRGV